jgi:hypothetical protein
LLESASAAVRLAVAISAMMGRRRLRPILILNIEIFIAWRFSSPSYGASAMQREPIKTDPDGFAEVWRTAEQRRAEDISGWLGQWFERRRLRVVDDGAIGPKGHPALGSARP